MADPKVLLHFAMSLEGYVAHKNYDITWLETYQAGDD